MTGKTKEGVTLLTRPARSLHPVWSLCGFYDECECKSEKSSSQPLFGSVTQCVLVTQWLPLRDETSKGRQEERIWLMKGRRTMTGKMWGGLGLDRFRSERSWDEYFYQLAAARLQRRDVSLSVTLFWTRTAYIGINKKKTGICVWALAKISARNVTGDHSEQSHALKNRIKIFFCSFLIEVNVFKLQTKK